MKVVKLNIQGRNNNFEIDEIENKESPSHKGIIWFLLLVCIGMVIANAIYFTFHKPLNPKEAIDFIVGSIGISLAVATLGVLYDILDFNLRESLPFIIIVIFAILMATMLHCIQQYFGDEIFKLVLNGVMEVLNVFFSCFMILFGFLLILSLIR